MKSPKRYRRTPIGRWAMMCMFLVPFGVAVGQHACIAKVITLQPGFGRFDREDPALGVPDFPSGGGTPVKERGKKSFASRSVPRKPSIVAIASRAVAFNLRLTPR